MTEINPPHHKSLFGDLIEKITIIVMPKITRQQRYYYGMECLSDVSNGHNIRGIRKEKITTNSRSPRKYSPFHKRKINSSKRTIRL